MEHSRRNRQLWSAIANDYGMVFVLMLLIAVLSVLTLEEQLPVGRQAGKQVAAQIASSNSSAGFAVLVAESTPVDVLFVEEAKSRLEESGWEVAEVKGNPRAARQFIEQVLEDQGTIDALGTTGDAASWTVFDRFDAISSERRFSPRSYTWPTFARLDNVLSVANQTAIYAIIAIGMTMVIVTAGIDLSVGSLVALASVTTAIVIRDYGGGKEATGLAMCVGGLAGVSVCAAAGLFNGVMVTRFRIPPFIATLAVMMIARGLARRWAAEESIQKLPASFGWIGGETTFGIPNPVLLMIGLYVFAHFVMSATVFGRHVYSVGGNAEAARLSGVPVKRVVVVVYTLCGALAGLGGVVLSSKLATGDPKLGVMYELDVIAAVVVGGTSLMGGEGRIVGTLIGAFIIAVIKNGMNLMNVGAPDQQIVLGAVVLTAVLIDTLKRKGEGAA